MSSSCRRCSARTPSPCSPSSRSWPAISTIDRSNGDVDAALERLDELDRQPVIDEVLVLGVYGLVIRAVIARERGDLLTASESIALAWGVAGQVADPDVIRLCLLGRSVHRIEGDPAATVRWLALVAGHPLVPGLHLAIEYDVDGLLSAQDRSLRTPAPVLPPR